MAKKGEKSETRFIIFRVLNWIRDVVTMIGLTLLVVSALLAIVGGVIEYRCSGTIRPIVSWIFGG